MDSLLDGTFPSRDEPPDDELNNEMGLHGFSPGIRYN